MAKKSPPTLTAPPFPALTWNDYFWEGRVLLPAWHGFQSRQGVYAAKSSAKKSDGTTRLYVKTEGDAPQPPSVEQAQAFQYIVANDAAVRDAMLRALLREYPAMRDSFTGDDEEIDRHMPPVEQPEGFKRLIGLATVLIQSVAKSGTAYVGFEFGCDWEEEHGLGFMMHKRRVVSLGGADHAILEWIAERDLKRNKKKS